MNKFLRWMFLLVLIGAMGTTQGQIVYFCDFEGTNNMGWMIVNPFENNCWMVGSGTATTNGGRCLYVSDDVSTYRYSNTEDGCFVSSYHDITISNDSKYIFSYDWKCEGEGRYDYMRVALVPGNISIPWETPNNFVNVLPEGWIALDDGYMSGSGSWTHYVKEVYVPAGQYMLTVCWHNDHSIVHQGPGAIDNIMVKEKCTPPSDIMAYNKSSDGFSLRWNSSNFATSWNMEYGVSGFTRGSDAGTIVTDIENNEYTLSGLEGGTDYDVYLWCDCSGEESDAKMVTVGTNCSYVDLPYNVDLSSCEDGTMPDCWTVISGSAEVKYDDFHEHHYLHLYENGCLASPKMAIPESGCIVELIGSSTSYNVLDVGYVTSLSNWDFHSVKQLIGSWSDVYYSVDFREVEEMPDSCYIVFKMDGDMMGHASWRLRDVVVEDVKDLPMPKNVHVTNATCHSITFAWDCDLEGASFEVDDGEDEDYDGEVDDYEITDTTSITFDPVYHDTKSIRVRTKVGDNVSNWSERINGLFDCRDVRVKDLYTEAISDSAVNIFWEISWYDMYDTISNIDGYVIKYKKVNSGQYTNVYVDGAFASCCLTGLSPDNVYEGRLYTIIDADTFYTASINRFKSGVPIENRLTGGDIGNENCVISNHRYNYSQSFYPSLGAVGLDSISGVAFHNVGEGRNRDVKMYIGFTDKFRLANVSQYIRTEDLEMVYDGSRYFAVGWDTIMFDHSVAVNHNKNIVIVLRDSTGELENMRYSSHHGYTLSGGGAFEVPLPGGGDMGYSAEWASLYSPDISFVGPASGITGRNPRLKHIIPGVGSLSYEWDKLGTESRWTINYRRWGVNEDWTVAAASIDEQSYTIENLIPGVLYEVRIGSLVGNDTLYTYTEDRTLPGLYPVPYMTEFSDKYSMDSYWITSMDYDAFSVMGVSNYLRMTPMGMVALPKFEVPINELMISFALYNDDAMSVGGEMIVGVCNDRINDIYSFVPIDTLEYNRNNPIEKWSAVFDEYDGDGENIVFYVTKGNLYIDTIWVDYIQNCIAPNKIQIVETGRDHVKVNWNRDGEGQSWEATIVKSGEDLSEGRTVECATNEVVFTDLEMNTDYEIYVHTVCGEERSEDVKIKAKTMLYKPIKLPFVTNFKDPDENDMWRYVTIEGDGKWGVTSKYGVDKVMNVEDSILNTVESSIALAYIPIEVEQDGRCSFSFDWAIDDEVNEDYLYMALVPYDFDFTENRDEYYYRNKRANGWIYMNGDGLDKNATSPASGVVMVPKGVYNLILMYDHRVISNEEIVNRYNAQVSHIELDYVNCGMNEEAEVFDITDHSAMISWNTPSGDVERWEIELNDGQKAIVTDCYYEAENLNGGMWYEATIRSMCGEGAYGAPLKVKFATECGDIVRLPYYNDFEMEQEGEAPRCWTIAMGESWVEDGVLMLRSGNDESNTTRIALPMFAEGIDFNDAKIVVDARGDIQLGAFNIYTSDDIEDKTMYVELANRTVYENELHFEIPLENVEVKKYIILYAVSDYFGGSRTIKINNFGIVPMGACEYPIEARVDRVGWDYVTVSWESEVEQSEWEAKISDMDGNEVERKRVTEPTTTFDGLVSGGQYKIKVRAICTEAFFEVGDYGKWTEPIEVATNCGVASDIKVTNITGNSAKISWTPGCNQTHWNVIYGVSGFYHNNLDGAMFVNTTEPEATLTGLTNGVTYEVYVKSICNENNYSMSMPLIFTASGSEGIDGVEGEYDLNIYPNPTSGVTTIRLNGVEGKVKISVVDINGRMISDETIECDGECEKRMDVEGLAKGTYFVRVIGDRINSVRKLVVH